jgi:hypothetical protein
MPLNGCSRSGQQRARLSEFLGNLQEAWAVDSETTNPLWPSCAFGIFSSRNPVANLAANGMEIWHRINSASRLTAGRLLALVCSASAETVSVHPLSYSFSLVR